MKTNLQKAQSLIILFRVGGAITLIAGIVRILGYVDKSWEEIIILGLIWLILANMEETVALIKDAKIVR